MGGRGTFAIKSSVSHTYKTIGKIKGVKVLQGINKSVKGLPVEAHSSDAYIQLHPDGKFRMYREYSSNRYLTKEIAYHPESHLTGNNDPVLHIHEYVEGDFSNRTTRLLTESEYEKYKKYFKGLN